jgi:hypothetical protein
MQVDNRRVAVPGGARRVPQEAPAGPARIPPRRVRALPVGANVGRLAGSPRVGSRANVGRLSVGRLARASWALVVWDPATPGPRQRRSALRAVGSPRRLSARPTSVGSRARCRSRTVVWPSQAGPAASLRRLPRVPPGSRHAGSAPARSAPTSVGSRGVRANVGRLSAAALRATNVGRLSSPPGRRPGRRQRRSARAAPDPATPGPRPPGRRPPGRRQRRSARAGSPPGRRQRRSARARPPADARGRAAGAAQRTQTVQA